MKIIDLRSDTVTKPSDAMRQAMSMAEVGDDVFGDDPTVNILEQRAADLFGKEAALFVATGTQGNLLSILSHCERGEEFIAGLQSHVYKWEAGGSCVLGGVYPQPIDFEPDGTLDLQKVKKAIKPDDPHFTRTKLLCIENTQGGKVLPIEYLRLVNAFAKEHGLKTHLDGARIFNASIATGSSVFDLASSFDSVTFCLSKGLGAPLGSIIVSDREFIKKARRLRKMVGGAMRQAGIVAAAGLYALEHNIERLQEDHQHASMLAEGLNRIGQAQAYTNMVFFEGKAGLAEFLKSRGILVLGGQSMRLVTHLNIERNDISRVIDAFCEFYQQ